MSARSSRRLAAALALFLLGALVVPPLITAGRFRSQITRSISRALGREVTVGGVSLRLLPQPGIDLQQFVVSDDPSFGAEPMLRASRVSATLRLTSLWRGRLEIGSLSLKEPSLNLARRADGQWNLAALLERNASIPTAPTGRNKPESRPRFPYIEADNGRINFKIGAEKKVYAFADADFALWLASENNWSLRLEARPLRTDANLSDTGTVQLSGSFQRSASAHETPFRLSVRWQRAQLGQLTRLIYDRDRGWRGTVDVAARLEGTPASFNIRSDVSVDEFRRYDILSNDRLKLAAHCAAHFSTTDSTWSDALCTAPVADGLITISGNGRGVVPVRQYDLKFVAQHVPMASVVSAVRHGKKDLPLDLTATGDLNGTILVSQSDNGPATRRVWAGGGETNAVKLISQSSGGSVDLGTIAFAITPSAQQQTEMRSPFSPVRPRRAQRRSVRGEEPQPLRVAVGPFSIQLAEQTAQAEAMLSAAGYDLRLSGEGDLQHIFRLAQNLGLHTAKVDAKGTAAFNVQVAGPWAGFAAPVLTGTAEISGVSAHLRGFSEPLQIRTAALSIAPDTVTVRSFVASFSDLDSQFSGSLELPRHCVQTNGCPAQFSVRIDQLSASQAAALFNPRLRKRAWYSWLERGDDRPLANVQAEGRFAIGRLTLGGLVSRNVTGELDLDASKFHFSQVRAELWGGRHQGEWTADYSGRTPIFSGDGELTHASLAQFASATGVAWAEGVLSLRYRIAASGWSSEDLLASMKSAAEFDIQDGWLRHISLDGGPGPLPVRHFSGRLAFNQGEFRIAEGELRSGSGIYQVTGTAQLDSTLDIRMVRDSSHAFTISGTLGAPRVQPRPQTEAVLKP